MEIDIYQVDAFADRPFSGNPAAVCPVTVWPEDSVLQAIASSNNLSETAFFRPQDEGFELRWFTPTREVPLCGHATLAAAWVLFEELNYPGDEVVFHTDQHDLSIWRDDQGRLSMRFPLEHVEECPAPVALQQGIRPYPESVWAGTDYMMVFSDEEIVRRIKPDMLYLKRLNKRGIIVTAPGKECDFVSRFFAPNYGLDEDPVTGSAHCLLAPFWAEKLNKQVLHGKQLSERGGDVYCRIERGNVIISGQARLFMKGKIYLAD